MSLGAFLAGVLLADSEFRHELEADVEPFKGLLLGLFFMAVGMSANLALFVAHPFAVLGSALGLMLLKVAAAVRRSRGASGTGNEDAQRIAVLLAQGGEFAFVLFTAAQCAGILPAGPRDFLVLVVTISMLLAPLSFVVHERLLERWLERTQAAGVRPHRRAGQSGDHRGYGRYGQIVSRVLRMAGIPFTALEVSYQQVDFVRRFGNKVYYGDATRLELLESARARDAKLFVLAIDDVEASVKTAALVRKHFPDLPILARARNRVHYYRLRDLGIESASSARRCCRASRRRGTRWSDRARARAGDTRGRPVPRTRCAPADGSAIRGAPGRGAIDPDGGAGGGAAAGTVRVRCQGRREPGPRAGRACGEISLVGTRARAQND